MKRAEHQVPGLGGLDRDADRLEVAQLADQDDVGVFAQRRAQRILERVGVRAHLALVDQAFLVRVHELDRILDRDDVILARLVDVVDHRAERRRLARARGPCHQHEPLVQGAQLQDERRQAQLFGGEDGRGYDPEHRSGTLAIGKDVRAEPGEALNLVGEVRIVALGELLAVHLRHDRPEELHDLGCGQRPGRRIERLHVAVLAYQRRGPHAQVQIRRARGAHRVEQSIDRRSLAHGSETSCTSMMCVMLTMNVASAVSTY